MSNTILIVGATSGIARATAYQFARHGANLVLAGRDVVEIERIATDIRVRHGVTATVRRFDALDYGSHPEFFASCHTDSALDGVILCYGYLGEQTTAQSDWDEARTIVDINYTSYVSLLHVAATYFEDRRSGFICAISSVAGDRGRQSNYVYGSAKGALSLFLQGLRNRLTKAGVAVITAKPGFVDTAMTYGKLKGGPLVAKPERVAADLYKAIKAGRDVVYLPWFWRYIMLIIKSIPETIFKRLSL